MRGLFSFWRAAAVQRLLFRLLPLLLLAAFLLCPGRATPMQAPAFSPPLHATSSSFPLPASGSFSSPPVASRVHRSSATSSFSSFSSSSSSSRRQVASPVFSASPLALSPARRPAVTSLRPLSLCVAGAAEPSSPFAPTTALLLRRSPHCSVAAATAAAALPVSPSSFVLSPLCVSAVFRGQQQAPLLVSGSEQQTPRAAWSARRCCSPCARKARKAATAAAASPPAAAVRGDFSVVPDRWRPSATRNSLSHARETRRGDRDHRAPPEREGKSARRHKKGSTHATAALVVDEDRPEVTQDEQQQNPQQLQQQQQVQEERQHGVAGLVEHQEEEEQEAHMRLSLWKKDEQPAETQLQEEQDQQQQRHCPDFVEHQQQQWGAPQQQQSGQQMLGSKQLQQRLQATQEAADNETERWKQQQQQNQRQQWTQQEEELQDYVVALQDDWTGGATFESPVPYAAEKSPATDSRAATAEPPTAAALAEWRSAAPAEPMPAAEPTPAAAPAATATNLGAKGGEGIADAPRTRTAARPADAPDAARQQAKEKKNHAAEGADETVVARGTRAAAAVGHVAAADPTTVVCDAAAAKRDGAAAAATSARTVTAAFPSSPDAENKAATVFLHASSAAVKEKGGAAAAPADSWLVLTSEAAGQLGAAGAGAAPEAQHVSIAGGTTTAHEGKAAAEGRPRETADVARGQAPAADAIPLAPHAGAAAAATGAATRQQQWRQQGYEKVVDLPADVLPNISWEDIRQRVGGPPKAPLLVSSSYPLDAPRPANPFERLINLDPAASLLLQLPHDPRGLQGQQQPSPFPEQQQQQQLRQLHAQHADEEEEEQQQQQQRIGKVSGARQQLLCEASGTRQQRPRRKQGEPQQQQQHVTSTSGTGTAQQHDEQEQTKEHGQREQTGEQQQQQQTEEQQQEQMEEQPQQQAVTVGDVEEAEGGAWVSGRWVSDEEIDRAREHGEAQMQPFIAEIREAVEKAEREDRARAEMETHPPLRDEEIDGMEKELLKKELRLRGYRTGGAVDVLRKRLIQAAHDGPRVFEEAAATEESDDAVADSVVSDAQKAWHTYQEAAEEVSQPITNPSDPAQVIRRWIARSELFKAADDPVDYFSLDMHQNSPTTSPEDLAAISESLEADKDGDVDEQDRASAASRQLHDLLGESIPKTFETREEEVALEEAPIPQHADWGDMNVDDRKRAFFEGNPNSIVKETVKASSSSCQQGLLLSTVFQRPPRSTPA